MSASIQFLNKKIPAISLTTFNLMLAVWLALVLNLGFLKTIHQMTPYHGYKSIIFVFATVLVLIGLYNFIFQILHWKYTVKVTSCILLFLGGMSAYFVNTLGVNINAEQVQNILQTDFGEAFDLLTFDLFLWFLFVILLPIVLVLIVQIKTERLSKTLLKKTIVSLLSLTMVLGILFVYYVDYASIFRVNRELKGMISPQNVFSATHSYYKNKAPKKHLPHLLYGEDAKIVQEISQEQVPKLMVLVVGETARAESFSLNGYKKNTNPELSKLNIINFTNVSSCGTATAVSVPCMFSGMQRKDYDEQLAYRRDGLLDIAQRAGYKVTWIENNSGCKGACDRVNTFVIPEHIKNKWCNHSDCDDGILVDSLKDFLAKLDPKDHRPQLIVLHQMGSHGPAYYKRSPPNFQPFKPICNTNSIQGCSQNSLLNTYDNSIVYTDHILSSLIKLIDNTAGYQTGFWYLSDHGESTGEHGLYLHGAPYAIAPTQQTHIPMLMWFSKRWNQAHQKQMICLNTQRKQNLSHDVLFPTLLHLLDIKSQVIHAKNDILNTCKTSI